MIIGICGKANVGKSTFFKALTLADVEIANYPFATIKPNHGIGFVKIDCAETYFNVKCDPREGVCVNGKRFVPVNVIDVAGLVPGAHEGKGLGSQFLSDLNQANALIHVIDASGSTNEKGETVEPGSYDPVNDVKFLEIELDYWYLDILKKGWDKFLRRVKAEHGEVYKAIGEQMSGVGAHEELVKTALLELKLDPDLVKWSEDDIMKLARKLRMLTKPMIIAANKSDIKHAEENIKKLKEKFPNYVIIPVSAETELALKEAAQHDLISYVPGEADFAIKDKSKLNEKQKQALEFIKKFLDGKTTGVQECINKAVFEVLKYKAIFPGGVSKLEDSDGNVLPDCFLLPEKATALDFAFKLHTDIGKNFVKAINVKKKLPIGKDHILENGDVVEIMVKN